MLYYTIAYYTIPYHTIPYYTILYYTVLYCTILYCTMLHHTISLLYYTMQHERLTGRRSRTGTLEDFAGGALYSSWFLLFCPCHKPHWGSSSAPGLGGFLVAAAGSRPASLRFHLWDKAAGVYLVVYLECIAAEIQVQTTAHLLLAVACRQLMNIQFR